MLSHSRAFVPVVPCFPSTGTGCFACKKRLQTIKTVTASRNCPRAVFPQKNYTSPTYTANSSENLLQAIKFNDYPTFERLIAELPNGANTLWSGNRANQSALLAACFRGRTDMIRCLIRSGADCSHRNDYGWGAVKYAKQWYFNIGMYEEGSEIVQLLIANGAEDCEHWRDP